jgi:protein-S-isoprenylcysteine O-methyltransferase Ste14
MGRAFLETMFFCGVALLALLELYYLQNFEADRKILSAQKKKRTFLFLLIAGIQVIPFLYIFSIDFGPTDYQLWEWLGFPVIMIYFFCIWLFIKSLSDLGKWWTPGQELKEDLGLVKTGAYRYVRHPMYLALSGIAVCQLFMLQNWIAGPASLFLVTPFIIYQIRREERLLVKYFGDDYIEYCRKTGMMWPKEDKMPLLRKILREVYKNAVLLAGMLWNLIRKIYMKGSSRLVNRSL